MATPEEIAETRRIGRRMAWLVVPLALGLLTLYFDDVLERRRNPNRDVAVAVGGSGELVLQRNRAGHYVVPGQINGQPVEFLLDTGATVVSVPARLGAELGLPAGVADQVSTANGSVTVRQTRIAELALGPFRLREVRAHLNPGLDDEQVLLGMSALKQLEFTQRGDTLILRLPGR